jgi:uncharacterized protein (DUF427 family)
VVTVETEDPGRDFPRMAAERGRVEPCPRRVRGLVDGVPVFDTTRARYVWEVPYYPQYYVPVDDVTSGVLVDEGHERRRPWGTAGVHGLSLAGAARPSAARVYGADAVDGVAGTVGFDFDALDWFEEDEPIIGHPRNPYVRLDALRSHRHVVVARDGLVLADTTSPVLLFETGLPTRYYIDRTDVDFTHLRPSDTMSTCPYKGVTSGYWSLETPATSETDLAWTYARPHRQVDPIAGLIAFYNEKLDVTVDGRPLPRPHTHFR